MQTRLAIWAPYIGALGAALIVAGIFMTLLFALPFAILLALIAVGIVLIAVYLFSRPRAELRQAVTGQRTLRGSNSLVLSAAFIVAVVLINFIVIKQFPARTDLTENQSQTLSNQTLQMLKGLTSPVQVTGFFAGTADGQQAQIQAEDELKKYQAVSDKLKIQYVDTQANPTMARDYGVVQDGTLVFEQASRRSQVVPPYDEKGITNAILKVGQAKQPAIYFTTGHGEQDSKRTDSTLTFAINDLKNLNYKVDTINLASSTTATTTVSSGMPADMSALVIAGPQQPFAPDEATKVKTYLDNGGRVLLMVDPEIDAGLKDMLNAWGLDLNNDLVIDRVQNISNYPTIPVVQDFPSNPITDKLRGYYVFLPTTRSVKQATGTDKSPQSMLETTTEACGITDFAALKNQQQAQCSTAKEEQGPLTLGYSVEAKAASASQPGRLVVIGNSQFAANQWLQQSNNVGNLYLFRNTINWLAGQDELISIPTKNASTHTTPSLTNRDQMFIVLSSGGLIPLAIFIIGALIWWRRR